jgi:hypothetical protein
MRLKMDAMRERSTYLDFLHFRSEYPNQDTPPIDETITTCKSIECNA